MANEHTVQMNFIPRRRAEDDERMVDEAAEEIRRLRTDVSQLGGDVKSELSQLLSELGLITGSRQPALTTERVLPDDVAEQFGAALREYIGNAAVVYEGGGEVDAEGDVQGANASALDVKTEGEKARERADRREDQVEDIKRAIRESKDDEADDERRMSRRRPEREQEEKQDAPEEDENSKERTSRVMEGLNDLVSNNSPTTGIGKMLKNIENAITNLAGGNGGMLENIIGNAIGGRIGNLGQGAGGAGGMGNILTTLTNVLRSGIGRVAGALGVAALAYEGITRAVDQFQDIKDVSVSQTGSAGDLTLGAREWADVQARQSFTGLSEEEAKTIQQSLIANRIAFDTPEYNRGASFAQWARTEKAMDVGTATDLYVNAVVRGGMSVEELKSTFDELSEKAGETGETLVELTANWGQAIDEWTRKLGTAGADIATGITEALPGDTGTAINALASTLDWRKDYTAASYLSRYSENYGQEAYAFATLDMFMDGLINSDDARMLYSTPIVEGGSTLTQYMQNRDWEGLKSALDRLNSARGDVSVSQFTSLANFTGAVQSAGLIPSGSKVNVSDPEALTEYFRKFMEDVDNAKSKTSDVRIEEYINKSGQDVATTTDNGVFASMIDPESAAVINQSEADTRAETISKRYGISEGEARERIAATERNTSKSTVEGAAKSDSGQRQERTQGGQPVTAASTVLPQEYQPQDLSAQSIFEPEKAYADEEENLEFEYPDGFVGTEAEHEEHLKQQQTVGDVLGPDSGEGRPEPRNVLSRALESVQAASTAVEDAERRELSYDDIISEASRAVGFDIPTDYAQTIAATVNGGGEEGGPVSLEVPALPPQEIHLVIEGDLGDYLVDKYEQTIERRGRDVGYD